MKKIFFLIGFILVGLSGAEAQAFTLSNFKTPESMIVDPEDGAYYVSNINGDILAKDGNGFISKINSGGNIVIQKFIGGKKNKDGLLLNAPKGLAIVGKSIYVTDIDVVKVFDKSTGKPTAIVDMSKLNVRFLNDIASDVSGLLYVSDMMTDRIFKIDTRNNNTATLFKEGAELSGPNGLIVNPKSKNLMVVTWKTGNILEIDRLGKIHILKKGLGNLDGIDYDNEANLYVSSFEKGEVYKIPFYGRGQVVTFMVGLTSPADISCDRRKHELLIPSFKANTVLTVSLLPKKTASFVGRLASKK